MSENQEIIGYIKRGFELKEQACYKQAIEMFYKALVIEPDNVELLLRVGELYYLLHNYSRAEQYPEQVLSQDDKNVDALNLLKKIYLREDKILEADRVAEQVYSISPTEETLLEVVKLKGESDLTEELAKYFPQIEKSAKCLLELANIYFNKKDYVRATELADKAEILEPDSDEGKLLRGKILFNKNDLTLAREIFESLGKNSENPEILNFQGLFKMDDCDFVEAIKCFSKAASKDSTNSVYQYNLGSAYFLNGWMKEAEAAYGKAIYLAPDNCDYRYSLAYMYYRNNNFEKAQKEIEFILERDVHHKSAKVIKALLLLREKDYLGAELLLKSNLDSSGMGDDFTLSSLAKVEVEIGKFESAETRMKSLLTRNSDNLSYKIELAEIYIKEKKFDEAIELSNSIFAEKPNCVDAFIAGAEAAYRAGKYDLSKEFSQNALSIDINCAAGYFGLARVRRLEGDFEEAIECMKRAITYDVNNAAYYAEMAELYKVSGDVQTAFEYVKEAENIDSSEKYRNLYREFAKLNRK